MSEASIVAALDRLEAAFATELAAVRDEVALSFPPEPGLPVITVRPSDDVQAALTSLLDTGGTILCQPGRYVTNLRLPARSCEVPIVIASDGPLPPAGTRVTSSADLPVFVARDTYKSVLQADPGSRGLHCVGLAFGPQAPDRTLIELGADQHTVTQLAQVPTDFAFLQCMFEGDPTAGQHRAISLNASQVVIEDSTFTNFFEVGRDSQALCGWNGTAFITIKNCLIEAGAENVLFGGGDSATSELMPHDVLIEHCRFTKNYSWTQLAKQPVIKNLFEVKALRGLQLRSSVFECCWRRDWPTGVALVIKAANQENGAPWSTFQDILIEDCLIQDVGSPFQLVGQNDGTAGYPTERGRGLTIKNVLAQRINQGVYLGTGKGFDVLNAPDDWVVDHLTMLSANNCILSASYAAAVTRKATGFKWSNSVVYQGAYGLHSPSGLGTVALDATFDGWQFTGTAIRKDPARKITFPPGNPLIDPTSFDASLGVDKTVLAGSPIAQSVTTTDGTLPGVDIERLHATIVPADWRRRYRDR